MTGTPVDPVAVQAAPGRSFVLPEIVTRLPEDRHRDCRRLDARTASRARPLLRAYFGDERRAERYLRQRISHYGCLAFPQADAERGRVLGDLCLAVTLYDDTFSRPGIQERTAAAGQLCARWLEVFDGKAPSPEHPAFTLVHRAVEAADALMPPHLAARARQAWRDMAHSHHAEAVDRNNRVTLDLDHYVERRLTNIYGWWLTTHVEFATGIDLGDLPATAQVMAARRAAIRHITLVNDLYSFPKELDAHEAMNVLLTFMRHDRLPLQRAVDRTAELIHRQEAEFHRLRDGLLRGPLGRRADVRAYLHGIGYLMTGNLRWSQISTRYFGDEHDGRPVTSGTVVLPRRPTVHT
ncbi:terpene synthase family protein [Streptomyces sp. G45]|uniref:terpene synthase family protein n=1 Tax=Streptomyces sp. G45 TaxID=3406627 RepID=UPI003C1C4FBB